MKKCLLLCVLGIGLVTGCAETPEDVKNIAEILDEKKVRKKRTSLSNTVTIFITE